MSLTIELVDEEGNEIDTTSDVDNYLIRLAYETPLKNSCCLRFIDPYGNTIFNRIQMTQFISEIDELINAVEYPEQKDVLMSIKSLAERCEQDVHKYIRIIGT